MVAQPLSGKPPTIVLVRAYGDEPVRLIAGRRQGRYIIVMNSLMDAEIGFPLVRVYRDDEKTYRALGRAYKTGDHRVLAELWKSAEHYVP